MAESKKAFCSWSGGKESALALYRAKKSGIEVSYLINMTSEGGEYSRTHGIKASCLRSQSEAIGIPVIQQQASWQNYEKEFKGTVLELKHNGAQIGIFGDIDLQEHRDWVERICGETGIRPILPLWKEKRERLFAEFIRVGFRAIVVTLKDGVLGREWLGRVVDEKFVKDIKAINDIDISGEKGEYHTFVFDGPIFKSPIKFSTGKQIFKEDYCFLELTTI